MAVVEVVVVGAGVAPDPARPIRVSAVVTLQPGSLVPFHGTKDIEMRTHAAVVLTSHVTEPGEEGKKRGGSEERGRLYSCFRI